MTGALYDNTTLWPAGFSTEGSGALEIAAGGDLESANLSGKDLSGANLRDARLMKANLRGTILSDADLSGADVTDALYDDATSWPFDFTKLKKGMHRIEPGAKLIEAQLQKADLRGADLRRAEMSGADVKGALYNESTRWPIGFDAEDKGAFKIGPFTDLSDQNLSKTDLRGALLQGAYLVDATFTTANLSEADLARANLAEANLTGANLQGSVLQGANLRQAILYQRCQLASFALAILLHIRQRLAEQGESFLLQLLFRFFRSAVNARELQHLRWADRCSIFQLLLDVAEEGSEVRRCLSRALLICLINES